ncbi:hypothetical protein [Pseudomonas putida]|uniref:Uncharacterized protein n=1 Tax=Pseudomonas putida TaxID=303 RepID=A0AAW4C2A5_PSEPU|nr:hypothetical protein [Pseudomonas putida]MBF8704701.1 hypothetical protein [Pseudomonas putida]MBF8738777.1 hypothetical protein [Pseudomonas putida]
MLNDIATTIKAQLYDRITSPLLGSFILSWCLWNWKVLLILVSNLSATEKITYIELNFFPTAKAYVSNGLAAPLLLTLIIIYLYPIPAKIIYRKTRNDHRDLKEIQQSIEDSTPMPMEDARALRQLLRNIQNQHEEEMAAKIAETATLKAEQISLNNETSGLRNDILSYKSQSYNLQKIKDESLNTIAGLEEETRQLKTILAIFSKKIEIEPGTRGIYTKNKYNFLQPAPTSVDPDKSPTSEYTLENYIQTLDLFANNRPAIRVIAGTVYLFTGLPQPQLFILGEITKNDFSQNLSDIKHILKTLDKRFESDLTQVG